MFVLVDTSVWVSHFRQHNLALVELLQAQQPALQEVADFIEREKLHNQGCGSVDMILLCATLLTPGTTLWTQDKSLQQLARRFGIEFKQHD